MARVVEIVRATAAPSTRTRLFRRRAPRVLPSLEGFVGRVTGGRVQLSGILLPSLILHITGAKSGASRDAPLMYTPDVHGRALVAGSNFADGRHPAWSTNLLAHPDAEITVRGRRMTVYATLVSDEQRDATWHRIQQQWPGYREYERQSGRVVRLFRLQPVRR